MSSEQLHHFGVDTDSENLGSINFKFGDGFILVDSKSVVDMVNKAVCEIRDALTVKPDGTIRFSRIEQSANYLEKSTIKFDGFNEGRASLAELKGEFPNLHNAIRMLHEEPTMNEMLDVLVDFQCFLQVVSEINEYAIFVLTDEKDNVREFSKSCCEYVLGNSECIELPEFHYNEKNSKLVKLADALVILSKILHNSIMDNA